MSQCMRGKTVELLSPGGSMEAIYAAVHAGADAVYAGGKLFGARAYALNPEQEDLLQAIDYCHLHGVRFYLTVNTLLKERELEEGLYDFIAPIFRHGVDAVLVQDFGVFHFLREHFPDLPLHASTQMTVMSEDGVRLLQGMGAQRVVLSRELSLEEIRRIKSRTDAELETFVHGALCYCYSGKCLMSSMIGGRSGNRGRCAQPCRLPYTLLPENGEEGAAQGARSGLLLSLKDICTLHLLPDLIEAGIASLKIEGRMKSPAYAAGVTAMYRKYIDLYLSKGMEGYRVDPSDVELLRQLFSRGPFSEGYYRTRCSRQMVSLKEKESAKGDALRSAQEAVREIEERFLKGSFQLPVKGKITMRAGERIRLRVENADGIACEAEGATAQKALSRPLDEDAVRRQLLRTGDTPFFFSALETELEDGVFIPLRELNALRRDALQSLEQAAAGSFRREGAVQKPGEKAFEKGELSGCGGEALSHPKITACVCTQEQLDAALSAEQVGGIYLEHPLWSEKAVQRVLQSGRKAYLALPHVWRADTRKYCSQRGFSSLFALSDGVLLRCYDQLQYLRPFMAKAEGKEFIADEGLYTWSGRSRVQLSKLGITMDTLPAECSFRELKERGEEGSEQVIYGRQVLMVCAQCLTRTAEGCTHRPSVRLLKDRTGARFPVRNDCAVCTNLIYNSVPLEIASENGRAGGLNCASVRYSFTVESGQETVRILRGQFPSRFTRGHIRKGVE